MNLIIAFIVKSYFSSWFLGVLSEQLSVKQASEVNN